jgi:drug/metabolite transporter (DMT)-like permease
MAAGITPEQIVIFRSFATALGAGIALVLTNRQAFRVQKHEWRGLIVFGIFGVALMQWSYSNAVKNLPIGIALLIEYTAIVIVPLVSLWLFKAKVLPRLWLAIVMVLGGDRKSVV